MPSDVLPNLVDELGAALSSDAYDEATDALDRLRAGYDAVELEEATAFHRATALREQRLVAGDGDRQTLGKYADLNTSTDITRSMLLTGAAIYLTDPEQGEREQLLEMASTLRSQEAEFVQLDREVKPLLADAELPGWAEVVSIGHPEEPHLKGSPFSITVTVGNVGDTKTEGGAVFHDSDAAVTPSSRSFDTLAEGATAELEFEVAADESGDEVATFGFDEREDRTDQRTAFEILGKTDLVDSAEDILASLESRIDEAPEITGGVERSLLKKLDAAASSLQRARRFANEGREKQANSMLDTASQQLGAFLNALVGRASRGNRGLPTVLERRIERQASAAIDNIAAARDAAV